MKKEMFFQTYDKTISSAPAGAIVSETLHKPPDRSFRYRVFSEKKILPEFAEPVLTFGICVFSETPKGQQPIRRISDVSTDRNFVKKLTELCNRAQLDPIHLKDVIEDALAAPV